MENNSTGPALHEFDIDKHPGFFYNKQANTYSLVAAMLQFSIKIYEQSYKLKNWKEFERIANNVWANINPEKEAMLPFMEEHLIDQIKITLAFENFIKAMLLASGNIIHVINKDIYPDIFKRQKTEPIKIEEIRTEQNYEIKDGMIHFKGLTTKTLSNNIIFEVPKYTEVLRMPDVLLQTIREINKERNQIHLVLKAEIQYSREFNRYDKLNKFVQIMKDWLKKFEGDHELQVLSFDK